MLPLPPSRILLVPSPFRTHKVCARLWFEREREREKLEIPLGRQGERGDMRSRNPSFPLIIESPEQIQSWLHSTDNNYPNRIQSEWELGQIYLIFALFELKSPTFWKLFSRIINYRENRDSAIWFDSDRYFGSAYFHLHRELVYAR